MTTAEPPVAHKPVLASQLFATSQGSLCHGPDECHWCGAPCERLWAHDDIYPIPFVKSRSGAKRAANNWICLGCWLWRRKRVTVQFLDGTFKDTQTATGHSWWITDNDAKALNPTTKSRDLIYRTLLKPPIKFCLSLTDNETNHLHHCVANDVCEIKADTGLAFTLNNILHYYSIYDLEEALRTESEGRDPGVRALIRFLGHYKMDVPEVKKKSGRPKESNGGETKKLIAASGREL